MTKLTMTASELAASSLAAGWFTAIATAVGVLVAGGALVAAWWQIRQTGSQLREASLENERNVEAQTRPYLGVEFVSGVGGAPAMDIVIANTGRTTASNIRLTLVNDFVAQSADDQIGPALGRLFAVPFTLAPQTRRRVFWRIPDQENAQPRGDMGGPIEGTVELLYDWVEEGRPTSTYREQVDYDLSEYPKLMPGPYTGGVRAGNSVEASMTNAVNSLRAIATHVAELRR